MGPSVLGDRQAGRKRGFRVWLTAWGSKGQTVKKRRLVS